MTVNYRALIVEDDPIAREASMFAFEDEGFRCTSVCDGASAMATLSQSTFDVVVTDLRIPKKNGHSLAVDLIGQGVERPLVVVLTGVLEPRLVRDLVVRGVDDVAFKPIDLSVFAAKVRALCERRERRLESASGPRSDSKEPQSTEARSLAGDDCISAEEIRGRLQDFTALPNPSRTAMDVFGATVNTNTSSQMVATAIQREPSLASEVLRFAKSNVFNPSIDKRSSVEQAVIRLGQRRVGDLALARAVFATLSQARIPCVPLAEIWRRAIASGICAELVLEGRNGEPFNPAGLFCTALLQPIARFILPSAFPVIYQTIFDRCKKEKKALAEVEACYFAELPGQVASTVLAAWGIPESIHRPLCYVDQPCRDLTALPEPLRRRAEILKVAGFFGELVCGRYEPWDGIDIPPAAVLKKLHVNSAEELLKQAKRDFTKIMDELSDGPAVDANCVKRDKRATNSVRYIRIQPDVNDCVSDVLKACGYQVSDGHFEPTTQVPILVNASGCDPEQLTRCLQQAWMRNPIIISDNSETTYLSRFGQVLAFPCSAAKCRALIDGAIAGS